MSSNLKCEDIPSFESFPKLIGELIKSYKIKSSTWDQGEEKKLRNNIYNIIFTERKDKDKNEFALSEIEKLIWYSHILKKKRKFDYSNKLDNLLKSLKIGGHLEDKEVQSVLLFLTHLTGNEVEKPTSGLSIPSPWISSSGYENSAHLPNEPLNYNDTRLDCAFRRWHYTHFPPHLFQIDDSVLNRASRESLAWRNESFNACSNEPGMNHRFNFFRKEENEIDKSCFGALTGPRKLKTPITPDTPLSIPNLPTIPDGYSFLHTLSYRNRSNKIHLETNKEPENTTVDEGYVSSRCSDAGNNLSNKDDIWEEVLKGGFDPERFTWESAKKMEKLPNEKTFATEVGPAITHRLWTIEQNYIRTIDLSSHFPGYFEVTSSELCNQILHLLSGIPSSNFYISEDNNGFVLREGLYYEGVTPESLRPHLQEFIQCGNKVLRLEEFYLISYTEDESPSNNLSMTSFKRAIRNFILYYRHKILELKGERRLIGLKLKTEALRKKIDFVYNICLRGVEQNWFLNSLSLIGELSKELLATRSRNEIFLLLYFFNSTCKPFLIFLEKWIYNGEFCDPNLEFLIEVNNEALTSRSRRYWTNGHTLRTTFIDLLPGFLKGVLKGLFDCGKSMNLLRICYPQNFLISNEGSNHPTVSLCSSLNEVMLKRIQCQKYSFEMTNLCAKSVVTLNDFDRQNEEKKIYLQNIAKYRHTDRLESFQDKKKSRLLLEVEKKRKVLEGIKEDIKLFEFWKLKRKEEEEREEEKALLQQKIKEEEKKMEEYKGRISLLDYYNDEMSDLKSLEDNLEGELIALRKDLHANSEKGISSSENKALCLFESSDNKDIQDIDNETLSQMSTTPDAVETPNIELVETPNEDGNHEFQSMDKEGNKKENIKESDNHNNNIDDGGNEASALDVINSNINAESQESTEISDAANCNIIQTQTNIDGSKRTQTNFLDNSTTVQHSELPENDSSTTEILDTINRITTNSSNKNKKKNSPDMLKNKNAQNPKISHEYKGTVRKEGLPDKNKCCDYNNPSHNQTDTIEQQKQTVTKEQDKQIDKNDQEKNSKNDQEQTNKNDQDPTSDLENGNLKEEDNDKYSEKIGMRKSRSESSSLKDYNFRMQRNKELNRFSLYDFNEAPVLIDKSLGNEEIEDDGERVTLLDEELRESISNAVTSSVQSYSKQFSSESKCSTAMASSFLNLKQMKKDMTFDARKESEDFLHSSHLSFSPIYIVRSLSEHLEVQSKLVNCALLSHFLVERKLLDHFLALKSFLLFNDVAFSRALIQNLIYKFPPGRPSPYFVSPVELNGILNETIAASSCFQSPFASNLFFVVADLSINSLSNPLEVIDLRYNVKWPLCIILDEEVLSMYSTVSKFLVRFHEVMLTIEADFEHLASMRSRLDNKMSLHYHQINLFRHEIQHIIRVLFGYITYQAVEGSWKRFQRDIRENVSTLEELYNSHHQFISEVSDKCFLTSNSAAIQILIEELFSEVILFHNVVQNSYWTEDFRNNKFDFIEGRMMQFRELSSSLNKKLIDLLQRDHQNHIEDLVLHLNFNDNFDYR